MGKIKNVMAYTNPLAWITGIPIFAGIVLSAMTFGVYKNTKKVIKEIEL